MLTTLRFEDIVSNMDEYTFHMLGCGAIGSSAATQLARTGAGKFCLYDMDKVEEHNIGVSHYTFNDIGKTKVQALRSHLWNIDNNIISDITIGKFKYYEGDKEGILVLGLDSMAARMEVVENIAEQPEKPAFLIDGRMGAEQYQQYIYNNITVKKYEKDWYSDEDSDPEPCTRKATSYCSNMSGSFISNSIKNLVMKQPYFKEIIFNFSTLILDKKKLVS